MPSEAAILDEAGTLILVNRAWRDFGIDNGAGSTTCGVGSNYLDVCQHAASRGDPVASAAHAALTAVLHGHTDAARLDYPCHSPTQQRWYQLRAHPLPGPHRVLVLHDDVTNRLQELTALRHDATHDPLTGLANRALLHDRLAAALTGYDRRDHHHHTAVLVLDLDDFKHVNDNYGHPAGDTVLTTLAGRLRTLTRTGDTIARWGGDEFVIVLTQAGPASARLFHERVTAALNIPFALPSGHLSISASIGLALHQPGQTPSDLLAAADRAALSAKAARRNTAPPP